MADLTEAIQEAYASSSTDEVILHTLELNHPSFSEPVRVVRDFGELLEAATEYGGLDIYGHTLGLEDGSTARFVGMMFDFELPEQEQNKVPELSITLDNVTREVTRYLDSAVLTDSPITVKYREYLLSSPNTIQYTLDGLTVRKVKCNNARVMMTALFTNLHNKAFPSKVYRPSEYPGLA